MDLFKNRHEAGAILATNLKSYAKKSDTIVLALPRGGVPVAYEIAKALSLPLDLFIVRKLGAPNQKELAIGAIATGSIVLLNDKIIRLLQISPAAIRAIILSEEEELKRREALYRGKRPIPCLENKTVILVDDGIATGASIKAAIKGIKCYSPREIIIATPVCALSTYKEIKSLVTQVVCPLKPMNFQAVGIWYLDFTQTTDAEVIHLLHNCFNEKGCT